jgi:hypothetical protein
MGDDSCASKIGADPRRLLLDRQSRSPSTKREAARESMARSGLSRRRGAALLSPFRPQ